MAFYGPMVPPYNPYTGDAWLMDPYNPFYTETTDIDAMAPYLLGNYARGNNDGYRMGYGQGYSHAQLNDMFYGIGGRRHRFGGRWGGRRRHLGGWGMGMPIAAPPMMVGGGAPLGPGFGVGGALGPGYAMGMPMLAGGAGMGLLAGGGLGGNFMGGQQLLIENPMMNNPINVPGLNQHAQLPQLL